MPRVHDGLQKRQVERLCLLAKSMHSTNVDCYLHVYPKTVREYERCKAAWAALEEDVVNPSAKMLVYKSVIIYCPNEKG
jgi:hypothetical protein